jgi:thiamine-monophosphate kinase
VSSVSSVVESLSDRSSAIQSCIDRYLYPQPRVRMGLILSRNRAASACMDLSDGLADAVRQVAEASGVGAIVEAGALPIEADARAWFAARGADAIDEAIRGGDDYELLIGVRPRLHNRLKAARAAQTPLTRIGVFTADRALLVRRAEGDTPLPRGYSHFR